MLLTALDINVYSKMNEFVMKNIIYCTAFHGNVHNTIIVMSPVFYFIQIRYILYSLQLLEVLHLQLLFDSNYFTQKSSTRLIAVIKDILF